MQQTANEHGWPHALVAYADFGVEDVRPQLDRLARYPLVRGVRMQLHWHENPLYRFAARPDLCADPVIRRNVGRLADYGWSFDLQVFAPQMADAAGLAEACPKVTFVLQHAGMLEDLSPEGRAAWRAGMARLARLPERRLQAFGTWAPSSTATMSRTSPMSLTTRWRSSVPSGACSAPIFRSKSSGPVIATSSTPTARRRRVFAPNSATPFLRPPPRAFIGLGREQDTPQAAR